MENLQRLAEINLDFEIVLITNLELNGVPLPINVRKIDFKDNHLTKLIETKLSHPKEFRNNFWFSALIRIYALAQFAESERESILHIESDVIVSKDFPFSKFEQLKFDMAYPIVSEEKAIPSLIFLKPTEITQTLSKELILQLEENSNLNDMVFLRKIYDKYSKLILPLPIGPIINLKEFTPTNILDSMDFAITYFGGYFDGADIGQFIFGDDPRNHRGISYLRKINTDNYLDVRVINFKFSRNRDFLSITSLEEKQIPVFCLHIHSKRRSFFKFSKGALKLVANTRKNPSKIMYWDILARSIFNSLDRRFKRLGL